MATQLQIKRSTAADSTPTITYGELAYSTRATATSDATGGYLWVADSANAARVIGGDHFVKMLDHTAGTLTASSAIVVNADKQVDELKTTNITVGASDLTFGTSAGVYMASNLSTAFNLRQSSDSYLSVNTTDKTMELGQKLTGSLGFDTVGDINFGAANSLTIQDSTGEDYMVFTKVDSTETVQVKQNLDIGANALSMTGNVSAGSADFEGDGASLTLKNDQAEHGNSDAAETTILFKDHKNNELGKIKGSHHGANDDAKGHLRFYTGASSTDVENTAATEALQIDSAQKSIFKGDVDIGTGASPKNLTVLGNLDVKGTTFTIDSTTVTVDDKNIVLGTLLTHTVNNYPVNPTSAWGPNQNAVSATAHKKNDTDITTSSTVFGLKANFSTNGSGNITAITITDDGTGWAAADTATFSDPSGTAGATDITITLAGASDATADGGGITLKGTSDKTILFDDTNDAWDLNQNLNLETGKVFTINDATVLSNNTLGSGVVSSSLTSVGNLDSGSITTNFGSIDNGDSNITSGGLLSIDQDSTITGNALSAGGIALGAGADVEIHYTGSTFELNAGTSASNFVSSDFTFFDNTASGSPTLSLGAAATDALKITTTTSADADLTGVVFDTPSGGTLSTIDFKHNGTKKFGITSTGITVDGGTIGMLDGSSIVSSATGGLTLTSSTHASTAADQQDIDLVTHNLTVYNPLDNIDPSLRLGASDNESMSIKTKYRSVVSSVDDNVSANKQKIAEVEFRSKTSVVDNSSNDIADMGQMSWWIDDLHKFTFQDGGIKGVVLGESDNYTNPTSSHTLDGTAVYQTSKKPYLDNFTIDGGVWPAVQTSS